MNSSRYVYAGGILLAGWVAAVGLLFPRHIDIAVPWALPPLHAQVIGALYLSGAAFMTAMLRSRCWSRQAVVVPMIAIWTGGLLIVLLAHWDRVERVDLTVAIWLVAYTALPLTEAHRLWQHRHAATMQAVDSQVADSQVAEPAPGWLRGFLVVAGLILTVTAGALLAAPARIAASWPWPAEPFVLHVYAPPLAAFGIGFLLAARRPLPDLAILLPATALFAAGVLTVSLLHLDRFRPGPATWVWFAGFTTVLAALLAGGGRILRYRWREAS